MRWSTLCHQFTLWLAFSSKMVFVIGCWICGGADTISAVDPAIGCCVDDDIAAKGIAKSLAKAREGTSEKESAEAEEHLNKHSYKEKKFFTASMTLLRQNLERRRRF